jgi:hypothetical protein
MKRAPVPWPLPLVKKITLLATRYGIFETLPYSYLNYKHIAYSVILVMFMELGAAVNQNRLIDSWSVTPFARG